MLDDNTSGETTTSYKAHPGRSKIDENTAMPVLPLREGVIFPSMMVTIPVTNKALAALIEESLPTQKHIVVCATKSQNVAEVDESDFHAIGTAGRVVQMMRQDERLILVFEGMERVRIRELIPRTASFQAKVEILESKLPPKEDQYWQAAVRNLRDSALEFIRKSKSVPAEAEQAINNIPFGKAETLTDFIAGNLSLPFEQKQTLLEQIQVVKRVDRLQSFLNEQLHITDLQNKLRAEVKSEFSEAQRRAYLREQLRAIQKELGENNGTDSKVAELEQKLAKITLADGARDTVDRELNRLQQISPSSPEYSGIVDYLETVASLPWNTLSDDNLDLEKAQRQLDEDHYGIQKIKQRIVEYLAVRKLNPEGRGPILCFLGPPGVGKTSLGKSIASALGREFARIALGGVRDEAEIRGHRRTYIGSMPGRLIQELRRVKTRNPVIMLDEIDKLGADFRGDPASALLEVLDPHQNNAFVDRYLDLPFDLSQVVFIATANMIEPIPAPLRDRMEVIHLPGYTPSEKRHIAEQYLIPRQLKENGVTAEQCQWQSDALEKVVYQYTRESGVRNLERELGSVVRGVAAQIAKGEKQSVTLTPTIVEDILGPPRVEHAHKILNSAPGLVNGLAYTPVGGEVLHIEAIRYPGTGKLTLTGQLGDVMRESVKAAESLVRSRATLLGIDAELLSSNDVHIHVPAGAIPKDGPSAGVAMFTALASLFSNKAVNHEVGMTGEISLQGLVLPIGGLKEKTLAALNAGIKTVLIPKGNEKDIPELAEEARASLKIVTVSTVEELLQFALIDESKM